MCRPRSPIHRRVAVWTARSIGAPALGPDGGNDLIGPSKVAPRSGVRDLRCILHHQALDTVDAELGSTTLVAGSLPMRQVPDWWWAETSIALR